MSLFSELVSFVKTDVEKKTIPSLIIFLNSVSTNPTAANLVAQLAKLEVDLLAAGPGIAQDVLLDLASVLEGELQKLQAATPVPPGAATPPA